jgi:Domain of unknown function (DUF397)
VEHVENWRTASYSGSSGGNCVEVGQSADGVAVRDTKRRDGAVLRLSAGAWRRLTDTLKK